MEPVEINAGQWYLRGLRADVRIDDRPALVDLGINDSDHVAHSNAQWSADSRYSWAVCDSGAASVAAESVRRFATIIGAPEHNSG